jgi:hypothetical protein
MHQSSFREEITEGIVDSLHRESGIQAEKTTTNRTVGVLGEKGADNGFAAAVTGFGKTSTAYKGAVQRRNTTGHHSSLQPT